MIWGDQYKGRKASSNINIKNRSWWTSTLMVHDKAEHLFWIFYYLDSVYVIVAINILMVLVFVQAMARS
jgi:nicotinamide riboside transporter PnuC